MTSRACEAKVAYPAFSESGLEAVRLELYLLFTYMSPTLCSIKNVSSQESLGPSDIEMYTGEGEGGNRRNRSQFRNNNNVNNNQVM